jgi:hypothetical protein
MLDVLTRSGNGEGEEAFSIQLLYGSNYVGNMGNLDSPE